MIRANLISEEYLYPFVDDVMEWWLIDSWLAERLKEQGEVIIEEYGCFWWGRAIQRAGDLHGRRNTRNLRERLTQLTTNKVSIPYSLLLDRNFVFKTLHNKSTANFHRVFCLFRNIFYLCVVTEQVADILVT